MQMCRHINVQRRHFQEKTLRYEPDPVRGTCSPSRSSDWRSGLFAVSCILPCFLFIHSKIFIEHLPGVKSYQGAEGNKIHNVAVPVEPTLCGWGGMETMCHVCVGGEGMRAMKEDRAGQEDGDRGSGRDGFSDPGAEA